MGYACFFGKEVMYLKKCKITAKLVFECGSKSIPLQGVGTSNTCRKYAK